MKNTNNKLVLFIDATCDMPYDFIKENDIKIVGLPYIIGEKDGFAKGATTKELKTFYDAMRRGENAKTSLVTYENAYGELEPFIKDGNDIIYQGLSSGLAKTLENAKNAGEDLAKKHGTKFFCPDSKAVSAMHYIIMKRIIKWRDEGKTFEELTKLIDEFHTHLNVVFTVEDLVYLRRGGRISGATKVMGTLLNIKPLITINKETGVLENFAKTQGRIKSIQAIADYAKTADPDHTGDAVIVHADCLADAELLKQKIQAINPKLNPEIIDIGYVIGTHTGPGALGFCWYKK
ncbi:MAG: DegV family protein [Christensenellaceae bacterium]|jgi:DegV family protein with EDD domain|nr:DegV family protein [Christensenellaceae bacterium]